MRIGTEFEPDQIQLISIEIRYIKYLHNKHGTVLKKNMEPICKDLNMIYGY
jgi:hypothetical protein